MRERMVGRPPDGAAAESEEAEGQILIGVCEMYALPEVNAREIVEAFKAKADELEVQLQFKFRRA